MALVKPPKFWINVPDGSTFSAIADATNDNFSIDMTIDSTGDDDAVWNHAKIVGGASLPLIAPNIYTITVRINMVGLPAPTVTFRSSISTPAGPHDGPYNFAVSDPAGSPYRAMIGIIPVGGGDQ